MVDEPQVSIELRMSALGQKQTSAHVRIMSALPPKADIRRQRAPVAEERRMSLSNPFRGRKRTSGLTSAASIRVAPYGCDGVPPALYSV
jgi:hypothetical protein